MRSYRPEELFDEGGALRAELAALAPQGERRMGANPHANGGLLLRDLELPDFRSTPSRCPLPTASVSEPTRVLGEFLRDVIRLNPDSFRIVGPDETASNRLGAVFEATNRAWDAETLLQRRSPRAGRPGDGGALRASLPGLARGLPADRPPRPVQLLRGVHPHRRLDVQPARQVAEDDTRDPLARPIASLNYLLSSHVWRQDHNGFSHQDPGFIDHVVNKKAEIVRVYLPPDANCLLSVADHCLRSRNYVNVIVAGKQPSLELPDDGGGGRALHPRARHLGLGFSSDGDHEPDVVLGCAGDVPTLETLAAAAILRERLPELRSGVVNVVDLMRLEPDSEHPHGLSEPEFDALFTTDRPVIFAYHGYPWLIHRLTYRRTNHDNIHVRGYKEEGTTTTPFDMVMLNDLDRFHLVIDVIDRVPGLAERAAHVRQDMADERLRHRAYTREHGDDPPDVTRLDAGPARAPAMPTRGPPATRRELACPRRQRRLEQPEAPLLDGRRRHDRGSASSTRPHARVDGERAARRARLAGWATADAVGHRIVHGGERFRGAVRIDAAVETSAARARRPRAAAPAEVARRARRRHARLLPRPAGRRLLRHRLPRDDAAGRSDLRAAGAVARALGAPPLRLPRALPCLGRAARAASCSGARPRGTADRELPSRRRRSLCAIADGRSVDTTMGFTPLEGLVMATRSGSVDPGLLLWLLEHEQLLARSELADALEHRSGLLGLAGSADMREVLARAAERRRVGPRLRSTSTSRLRAGIAAMAARSGGSTRSCSPAVSASTRPGPRAAGRGTWVPGSRSTTRQSERPADAQIRSGAAGQDARARRARGSRDSAAG